MGTYPPAGEAWDSDPVTLLAFTAVFSTRDRRGVLMMASWLADNVMSGLCQ